MKCFPYNMLYRPFTAVFVFALMIGVVNFADVTTAQEGQKTTDDQKTIHVTSDLLTSDNETGFVEFSGNVRAVQGTTIIVSDRLKVFFKEDADSAQRISGGMGAVEKIIAVGNVKIDFDDRQAISDEAEYVIDTQVLVLSGPNTKVTTENESISGAKITLYRADGHIKVEAGEGKRVEAFLYDKGQSDGD